MAPDTVDRPVSIRKRPYVHQRSSWRLSESHYAQDIAWARDWLCAPLWGEPSNPGFFRGSEFESSIFFTTHPSHSL
jgi:hypothetical protein